MDITTEYRSHWVAADGTRHPSRRDSAGRLRDLRPILNLDEVRAWLALSTSDRMASLGFPGGADDARVFYTRQFLDSDCPAAERERLAPLICEELTDDVPIYYPAWRQPFIALRNRWPGVDGQLVVPR